MNGLLIFLAVLAIAGAGIILFRQSRKPQGAIKPGRAPSNVKPRQED